MRRLLKKVLVGKPLLSEPDDYKKDSACSDGGCGSGRGECLILMGHGTDHHANSAYPALEYTLQALGYDRIHVATVEGFPELKDVMHRIEQKQYRKVALLPFMFCGRRSCKKMTWQEMRILGNVSWKKPDMKFARS